MLLLPFVTARADLSTRATLLALILVGGACLNHLASAAWLSWVADVVPSERRSEFYSGRFVLTTATSLVVYLGAGVAIDALGLTNPWSYVIVGGAGFVLGQVDLLIHSLVPEKAMPPRPDRIRWTEVVRIPWQNRGFRNFLLSQGFFACVGSFIGPFIVMYQVDELGLEATWVCGLMAIMMFASMVFYPFWRLVGRRLGFRAVYHLGWFGATVSTIPWFFLLYEHRSVFLPVLIVMHVFFGFFYSAVGLSTSTLNMDLAPEKSRSAYFAAMLMVMALAMSLGMLCGRWIYLATNPWSTEWLGTKLTGLHAILFVRIVLRLGWLATLTGKLPEPYGPVARPRFAHLLRGNPFVLFPTLLALERPASERRRVRQIRALGRTRSQLATQEIIAATQDPSREVRTTAIEALGKIGDEDAVETLVRELKDPHSDLQAPSAAALGEVDDARGAEALVEALGDARSEIRAEAARALGGHPRPEASRALLQLLAREKEPGVIGASAESLGRLRRVEAVKTLFSLMRETQNEVLAKQSAVAIGNVIGREGEFYHILNRENAVKGEGMAMLIREAGDSGEKGFTARRYRALARRMNRLFESGDRGACLATLRRGAVALSTVLAEKWKVHSEDEVRRLVTAAWVVDSLAARFRSGAAVTPEGLLLAAYAYVNLVRALKATNRGKRVGGRNAE